MKSRRELILLMLGLSCSVVVSPSVPDIRGDSVAKGMLDPVCIKIFMHWSEHETLDPFEYLGSFLDMNDSSSIAARIHEDFDQGNIYMYEGLVASRTEIALLASLGKEVIWS